MAADGDSTPVVDESSVAAVRRGWETLFEGRGTLPTQGPDWAQASIEAFAGDGCPHLVSVGGGAELAATAQLVLRQGRLELLGLAELYEPSDLLARSPADLERLCAALARLHLPLRLGRLPATSPTPAALRAAFGPAARVVVRPAPSWPSLALDDRWTELGGGLSARRASDLRRALRRAESEGPPSVRLLTPEPGDVPALLAEAFAVEARSWKGASGGALAHDPRRAAFFRRYCADAASLGRLRIAFLDVGGRAAAMQIAVEWQRSSWLLKIGYDEALARCSPGVLLLAHAIRDAARGGLETFELLGTTEGWLRPWMTTEHAAVSVSVYPLHPRAVPGAARALRTVAAGRAGRLTRRAAKAAKAQAVRIAEARYLAGPVLDDALRVEAAYRAQGLLTTVGYWNADDDEPGAVAGEYEAQIGRLAGAGAAQISIKTPAVGDDADVVARLIEAATKAGVGVHLDALAPETQPAALDIACSLAEQAGGRLGCTLPGRWQRSCDDAERVARLGLRVRVVKSEWPSPEDPGRDPRRGFLDVVEALVAAGAPHVAIATHDRPLAVSTLATLREAGTSCEMQILHGMQARPVMNHARELGVPVRVYVPYGHGRLPYSVTEAPRDPRVAARLARDLIRRNGSL